MYKTALLLTASASIAFAQSSDAALVAYFPINQSTDSSNFLDDVIDDASHGITDGTTNQAGGTIVFNATRGGDVLSTVEGHRYLAGTQDIDLADGFTWSFWVNVASSNITDAGADVILGTRDGGTWHKIDRQGISSWNGTELTYTDLSDDTWHHIAYVGDSTSREIWIDGVEVDTDTSVGTAVFNGNFEIGGDDRFGEYVTGLYDDIAVWNEKLSDADIAALFAGASPLVVPEPSSLALIGLGGLLIARRRRG